MYNIIKFDTLPSTNLYLKQNYQNYNEFTIITTDNQTNGKGRMTRIWNSSKDDLTFSILLTPTFDSSKLPLISLIIGAALCNVINRYISCSIKWPNDIIINDKKVAGILVEGVFSDKTEAVIVGIGINVNQVFFSDDLIIKATSLRLETNNIIDKDKLLKEVVEEFITLYNKFLQNDNTYLDIVKNNNYLKNKEVYLNNQKIKVLDINNNGNLIILEDNMQKEIYFGEVTLNQIYK